MLGKFASFGLAAIAVLTSTSAAVGQGTWADEMVAPRKIDFGVIATGSESIREIKITNTTKSVVHINNVAPGCQCVVPGIPSQNLLQPDETATIEIRMNTRSFKQQRDTYLTITFDAPQLISVRVPVTAYIRTDVVFTPGKIDFGSKEIGVGGEVKCRISYAGRPDWNILDIKYTNKNLNAVLKEISRSPGEGTADFELTMTLSPDALPGRIREIVTIVTDDAASPNVPLMVEGVVKSDITLANDSLSVGTMKPGETKVVQATMHSPNPFVVEEVVCSKMQKYFNVTLNAEEKKFQIIRLEFTAPDNAIGKFREEMEVRIKGRKDTYKFAVVGDVR